MEDETLNDSESETNQVREPDPSSVQFSFIKTGGSQEHGILFTHHSAFKWHKQHVSKDGMTIW